MKEEIRKPRYSILLSGQDYNDWSLKIRILLNMGIKVFWINDEFNESSDDEIDYEPYKKAYLLVVKKKLNPPKMIIKDGKIEGLESLFKQLSTDCDFDTEQYLIEHYDADSDIVVSASAGTGKTFVMMDRIMYLIHMVPGLRLSDISLITFTNEASNVMRDRLQNILINRFRLTHNTRYMELLEEQSSMNIGTIHSFELELIREMGSELGLSRSVEVNPLSLEIIDMIDTILNDQVSDKKSVVEQIGTAYYDMRKLAIDFWNELSQKGYDEEAIKSLDWGETNSEKSKILQDSLKKTLCTVVDNIQNLKRVNDSVLLSDMQCDLKKLTTSVTIKRSSATKYLFIDEFQDTDDAQISIITGFVKTGIHLFAVGDVKQSIYRFRGANSNSFQILEKELNGISMNRVKKFELYFNYRSSPTILESLDKLFKRLSKTQCNNSGGNTLLPAFKHIRPMKVDIAGSIDYETYNEADKENIIVKVIKEEIDNFNKQYASIKDESKLEKKHKVVALVRTNWQLNELEKICSKNDIPAMVSKEGSFYQSPAVRDLKNMLGAFVFTEDPVHLFNYLEGPYSGKHDQVNLEILKTYNGDKEAIINALKPILNQTKWTLYKKMFKELPVLAVLEHMINKGGITEEFGLNHMKALMNAGYKGDSLDIMMRDHLLQYSRNLNKLLEILHDKFRTLNSGCYDLYNYLKVQMATNHEEKEALALDEFHKGCIHCMTVHAAKGLEFDTVIIPFTDTNFHHFLKQGNNTQNRLLIDDEKIGWIFNKGKETIQNVNYGQLIKKECNDESAEEARLLYVAMTRAIRRLIILMPLKPQPETWSELISKHGGE